MGNLGNSGRKRVSSVKVYLLAVDFPGLGPGNQRAYSLIDDFPNLNPRNQRACLLVDDFPCRGMGNHIALVSKWKSVFVDGLIVFTPSIFLFYGFSDLKFRFLVKNNVLSLL